MSPLFLELTIQPRHLIAERGDLEIRCVRRLLSVNAQRGRAYEALGVGHDFLPKRSRVANSAANAR